MSLAEAAKRYFALYGEEDRRWACCSRPAR